MFRVIDYENASQIVVPTLTFTFQITVHSVRRVSSCLVRHDSGMGKTTATVYSRIGSSSTSHLMVRDHEHCDLYVMTVSLIL